jgi:hypothetical protein
MPQSYNGRSGERNWEGKREEKQEWCNLNGSILAVKWAAFAGRNKENR